jgi:hypothetical protein
MFKSNRKHVAKEKLSISLDFYSTPLQKQRNLKREKAEMN